MNTMLLVDANKKKFSDCLSTAISEKIIFNKKTKVDLFNLEEYYREEGLSELNGNSLLLSSYIEYFKRYIREVLLWPKIMT